MTDNETRLAMMSSTGVMVVDTTRVNVDDVVEAWPGCIIRCSGDVRGAVQVVGGAVDAFGCVAGWISEED